MRTPAWLFASVAAALLAACSSSNSSSGGSVPAESPLLGTTFGKYCTGTLKTDQKLMKPMSGGGWLGDGTLHAAAGTKFVLEASFDHWEGYVFFDDKSPGKIDAADFFKGLVKDTDFTSDCATDPMAQSQNAHEVLLADAQLFAHNDLSGTACTMTQGTELTQYSYQAGGTPGSGSGSAAQVSSTETKSKCGFDPAFSSNFETARLVAR